MKILDKSDTAKLIELYRLVNLYNEEKMIKLITNINKNVFLFASIEDDCIVNLISLYLNHNNYYINELITLNGKISSLFLEVLDYLKNEGMALNIIYDNTPYKEQINSLLTNVGFNENYIEYLQEFDNYDIIPINEHIVINDKSKQVVEYIRFKSHDDSINIDNINTAVIRDTVVKGVVSFSKINGNIVLSNLFGEDEKYIIDLIHLIRNLTNKSIEITIKGNDEELKNTLKKLGFIEISSDYTYKLI